MRLWNGLSRIALGSAVAACLISCPAALADEVTTVADASAVLEWSNRVWECAEHGESDRVLEMLYNLPDGAARVGIGDLPESVAAARVNLDKAESTRTQRLAEVRAELSGLIAENNTKKAMASAIELQTLTNSDPSVLDESDMKSLIASAEREAHRLESAGKWLDAYGYFASLNVLYENQDRYTDDLKRLAQRWSMLRLYAPEKLHNLRSEQRVADGLEALPPYNAVGDDWQGKLETVSLPAVARCVTMAGVRHVEHSDFRDLLIGGYKAVQTMLSTADIYDTFPGLRDAAAREAFDSYLREQTRRIGGLAVSPDPDMVYESMRDLLKENARSVGVDPAAVLHEFGNGAMGVLDEYSSIEWPYEVDALNRTTEGQFQGVGIQITLDEAQQLKVVAPLPDTPAARARVRSGDIISAIDGETTLGIDLNQAVEKITGPAGTDVVLTIERQGEDAPMQVSLTRERIVLHTIKGWERNGPHDTDWDWFIDPQDKIGYVRISGFSRDTSGELRSAILDMKRQGAKGVILDLRYNPGGLLDEAVNVANLFVDEGVIVQQVDNAHRVQERRTARRGATVDSHIPMVVLINGGSASASEIVAGALQDYGKAILVGERSYGKGSVQNVYPLGRMAFKLTEQYYQLPGGRLIHRRPGTDTWGLEPDVKVSMLPSQIGDSLRVREEADIVEFGRDGRPVADPERPSATKLLTDGIDPQLETGVLLLKSRVAGAQLAAAGAAS
ncbi:MAG: S41 family peptidase [Phycisphaerales bacterium]|nr:S41 family peptidase [Phycisphaerales bacterium]